MCFAMNAEAQTPCDAGRYSTELFSSVTETTAIQFGQNVDFISDNKFTWDWYKRNKYRKCMSEI